MRQKDQEFATLGNHAGKSSHPGLVRDSKMAPIIVLFTDFGLEGPYTGQVKTVLQRAAPGSSVIDLFAAEDVTD